MLSMNSKHPFSNQKSYNVKLTYWNKISAYIKAEILMIMITYLLLIFIFFGITIAHLDNTK